MPFLDTPRAPVCQTKHTPQSHLPRKQLFYPTTSKDTFRTLQGSVSTHRPAPNKHCWVCTCERMWTCSHVCVGDSSHQKVAAPGFPSSTHHYCILLPKQIISFDLRVLICETELQLNLKLFRTRGKGSSSHQELNI